MDRELNLLAGLIEGSSRLVFFGGAGVSTESGIPDFRSASGLYSQKREIPPETILSASFFYSEPALFYQFYREKLLAPKALPNAAHRSLKKLEDCGKLRCIITQNIDGLHQAAGSKKVLELHGSVHRNYCTQCRKAYGLEFILESGPLPLCGCGGLVRPDVVLYEEGLDTAVVNEAVLQIQKSDLMIVGGTSLSVYPAAAYAQMCPGKLAIINRDATPLDSRAAVVIRSPIGQAMSGVMEILGNPLT